MDALRLVRLQAEQNNKISAVETEITNARPQKNGTSHPNLKSRLDAMETGLESAINGLQWKPSVATFNDLKTTYPNALEGWTASTNDTNEVFRYDAPTQQWQKISAIAYSNATQSSAGLMSATDKTKLDNVPTPNTILTTAGGQTINGNLTVTGTINGNATSATTATKVSNKLTLNVGGVATEYDGSAEKTVSVASADHTHGTDKVTALTGYTKGTDSTKISTSDTLNQALAKLENQIDAKASNVTLTKSVSYTTYNVTADNKVITIPITGYVHGTDILEVYISGVLLAPTVHYKLTATASNVTLTSDATTTGNTGGWLNGDVITLKVTKINIQ